MTAFIAENLDKQAVIGLALLAGGFLFLLISRWLRPEPINPDLPSIHDLSVNISLLGFRHQRHGREPGSSAPLNPLYALCIVISFIAMAAGLYLSFPFIATAIQEFSHWLAES